MVHGNPVRRPVKTKSGEPSTPVCQDGVVPSTTRPYRGVSAEDRRAQRRTRLIAAGLDLLGTVGWEQTTMTAVCARAKLTERYFYEHFTGRDQLLLAVVDQVADEARTTVVNALATAPREPRAAAHAMITAFVDFITDDPRKGRAALVESAAADSLRARRHELLREFAHLVVVQAHALFGARALPPPRDEINALLFVGGLAELLTAWLSGEITASRTDIVDVATDQFVATAHR
jgi:AcrR family transcriptional regulator